MSKRQALILLGVWIMVILYLGFPDGWDKFLLLLSGFGVIVIAYRLKSEAPLRSDKNEHPYVDHHNPPQS